MLCLHSFFEHYLESTTVILSIICLSQNMIDCGITLMLLSLTITTSSLSMNSRGASAFMFCRSNTGKRDTTLSYSLMNIAILLIYMIHGAYTTRKVLIDNVPKSSTKGYFSSPMGLTRRYGFCCRNCVRQSPTTIFSVRRAWAPFRHGKSDRCGSVFGSPLTADVMQTDTWQTPLTAS
jgi:hypothetical protein